MRHLARICFRLLAVATLLMTGRVALAQNDILFIGNSFTHANYDPALSYNKNNITDANGTGYGGVPGIFKQLTVQASLNFNVTIEAVSSATLNDHYSTKQSIIADPKWDTVVLQEQSTTPLPTSHGGSPTSFYTGAGNIKNLVRSVSPSASMVLYETWSSPTSVGTQGYGSGTTGLHAMQDDLTAAYFKAYYDLGFNAVARVGDGFMKAVDTGLADPANASAAGTFNIWGPDSRHPSQYGAYLSAAILFSKITGVDTRTLSYTNSAAAGLGINSTDATNLNAIAYQINNLANPAQVVTVTPPTPSPKTITSAAFSGSVTTASPPNITGNATVSSITTSEGTFSLLTGATANNIATGQTPSSVGTTPASANVASTGLTANDGTNNLDSGNFQFTGAGKFDANTRFFIIESAPSSGSIGDATTVTLIDSTNTVVGTYSLALTAANFGGTLATLNYTSGVSSLTGTPAGTVQSKLGGVTFSLADLGVTDYTTLSTVTGIHLSSGTLDPNVVGLFAVPEPASASLIALTGVALLKRRRRA